MPLGIFVVYLGMSSGWMLIVKISKHKIFSGGSMFGHINCLRPVFAFKYLIPTLSQFASTLYRRRRRKHSFTYMSLYICIHHVHATRPHDHVLLAWSLVQQSQASSEFLNMIKHSSMLLMEIDVRHNWGLNFTAGRDSSCVMSTCKMSLR